MDLGAGDVELLAVARQLRAVISHLPVVSCFGLASGRRDIERVEVHPAVALREEPDAVRVGQELDAGIAAEPRPPPAPTRRRAAVDDLRLAGLGIERDEPAILVVGRTRAATASLPSSDRRGIDQRMSRSALRVLPRPVRRVGVASAGDGPRAACRSSGSVLEHRRREVSVGPGRLAGLEVQHREQPAILRVADVGPALDVFGVAASR